MIFYEVLLKGYDGATDETDKMVLWVGLEKERIEYFEEMCQAYGVEYGQLFFSPQLGEIDYNLGSATSRLEFETALSKAASKYAEKKDLNAALGKTLPEIDAATRASDKAFVALLGDPEKEREERAELLKQKVNENLRVSEALGAHKALQYLFELMSHMGKNLSQEQREYAAFLAVQLEAWLKKEYPL